jgi:hypothetical protein
MLYKFLKTLQNEEAQNLPEIAQVMHISLDMALKIADDLSSRGYLQEIGTACDMNQKSCSGCSLSRGCQVVARHWFLTEKGRNAIADREIA